MGIKDGVTQASVSQLLVKPFVVGAFRQPNAPWRFTNEALVFAHGCAQLALNSGGGISQQRQITMGGAAGQQVEHPLALQLDKVLEHITATTAEGLALPFQVLAEIFGARLLV